jgi:hypothetical protein
MHCSHSRQYYAVDIVGILNETASESEEQVCELFKFGRGFHRFSTSLGESVVWML